MAGIAFKDSDGNIRFADENAVISSYPVPPAYAKAFADYLLEVSDDLFEAVFDFIYEGNAEWAGLRARMGWHLLMMSEEYRRG